jgi:hypothetical protein
MQKVQFKKSQNKKKQLIQMKNKNLKSKYESTVG